MFNIEDYNYDLREELIAQIPASSRDDSRLLFIDRSKASLYDHHFFDLPSLLRPGDLLVINNTRVVPARLYGRKKSGGQVEILVLEHPGKDIAQSDSRWCLLKSSKRPKHGATLFFENDVSGVVEALGDEGLTRIRFHGPISIDMLIEKEGRMPLPPYIRRDSDCPSYNDSERYQTIFSKVSGAVAAPTAGLHFTETSIEGLTRAGISIVELTLHIGHGTFKPVRSRDIREHNIGEESYFIDRDTAESISLVKKEGGRIIAVGTTVVRALETSAELTGEVSHGQGKTNLLITPGFKFKVIDGIITNFHLPKSSLLFLVSAFGGMDLIKEAYRWAIQKEYRFYSYGDAMLII